MTFIDVLKNIKKITKKEKFFIYDDIKNLLSDFAKEKDFYLIEKDNIISLYKTKNSKSKLLSVKFYNEWLNIHNRNRETNMIKIKFNTDKDLNGCIEITFLNEPPIVINRIDVLSKKLIKEKLEPSDYKFLYK